MFRALTRMLRRGTLPDPAQLGLGLGGEAPAAPMTRAPAPPKPRAVDQQPKAPGPDKRAVGGQTTGVSARAAEQLLERFRAHGMRDVNRCVLTRNRTVLVSVRGDVLRVHTAFLNAPDDVLAAIATFTSARSRTARLKAKKQIVGYRVADADANSDAGPRRLVRRTRTLPADVPMAERLRLAHARLNVQHFGGQLGAVDIEISRRMKRRLGHFAPGSATSAKPAAPEIAISRRHIRRDGWAQAEHTLLHEMVHQWQHETGRTLDHGRDFRRKAREVGIEPRATRRPDSLPVGQDG